MAVQLQVAHGREHSARCDKDPEENKTQVCRFLAPSVVVGPHLLDPPSLYQQHHSHGNKAGHQLKRPDGCDGGSCRNHLQPPATATAPAVFWAEIHSWFCLFLKESEPGTAFLFNKWGGGEMMPKERAHTNARHPHHESIFGSCCLSHYSRGAERYRQQLLTAINTRG